MKSQSEGGLWDFCSHLFCLGMKMLPMFVAWQKNKPRVITDHAALGLNDGIPRAEGQVKYDDMHPFGQMLYEWLQRNPD